MAYKVIYDSFWTDPKIKKLKPETKLIYLYFITNHYSHYSGIYYIPLDLICIETGLPKNKVNVQVNELIKAKIIRYDADMSIIWVIKMAKYQINGIKQIKGTANHFKNLHNCLLIKDFLDYYKELKIPYAIPYSENNGGYHTVTVTETVTEEETEEPLPFPLFSNTSLELITSIYLRDKMLLNTPKFKAEPKQLQSWSSDVEKMIRIDNRTREEIIKVIDYSQDDDFWKCNIRSMPTLRKQFDKLELQMKRPKKEDIYL